MEKRSRLTPETVGGLNIAKVFVLSEAEKTQRITSLSFDRLGNACVCSSTDDSIRVYDPVNGK
jgi:WD40 repeat protein